MTDMKDYFPYFFLHAEIMSFTNSSRDPIGLKGPFSASLIKPSNSLCDMGSPGIAKFLLGLTFDERISKFKKNWSMTSYYTSIVTGFSINIFRV